MPRAKKKVTSTETLIRHVHNLIKDRWKTAEKYFQVSTSYSHLIWLRQKEIILHFEKLGLSMKVLCEKGGWVGVAGKKKLYFLCTKH